MISPLDKAILGSVGVILTGITGAASAWSWSMMSSNGQFGSGPPGAVVAELSLAEGSVKTRHRETLAWTDGSVRQLLREGDRIRTLSGSRAAVRYGQGLEVLLDPDSQITVHGPVDAKGETLIARIDVFDGSIHTRVNRGQTIALRDAAGREQARVTASQDNSELSMKAPEEADGSVDMMVVQGSEVTVQDSYSGATSVLKQGDNEVLGMPTPTPTPEPTRIVVLVPTPTPVPPIDTAAPSLRPINFDGGDVLFRDPLPEHVVAVEVRGSPATLHPSDPFPTFEVELFGLPPGITNIDVVYKHDNGTVTRQVQTIRVR